MATLFHELRTIYWEIRHCNVENLFLFFKGRKIRNFAVTVLFIVFLSSFYLFSFALTHVVSIKKKQFYTFFYKSTACRGKVTIACYFTRREWRPVLWSEQENVRWHQGFVNLSSWCLVKLNLSLLLRDI
jgi:hypothetical protein